MEVVEDGEDLLLVDHVVVLNVGLERLLQSGALAVVGSLWDPGAVSIKDTAQDT